LSATLSGSLQSSAVRSESDLQALAREARSVGLVPHQVEQDPEWLAITDHGDGAFGAAIVLRQGGALRGYLPLRYRRVRVAMRLGEIPLAHVPLRTVQIFGTGVVGTGEDLVERALTALGTLPFRIDVVTLEEVPVASDLWRCVESGRARPFVTVERERSQHHVADIPANPGDILARVAGKGRRNIERGARKAAADLGPLDLRVYASPASMRDLLAAVEPVAVRTFQCHLLGHDLTLRNTRLLSNLERWAERGWVRAYTLSAGTVPLAYAIGFMAGRRYSYETIGYDPAHLAYSPGTILLTRILADLAASKAADVLDFGAGDADYKQRFSTRVHDEVHLWLARRTPYALGVAGSDRLLAHTARLVGVALRRVGLKSSVRTLVRRLAERRPVR